MTIDGGKRKKSTEGTKKREFYGPHPLKRERKCPAVLVCGDDNNKLS